MTIHKISKRVILFYILTLAFTRQAFAEDTQPQQLLLPFKPCPRETIDYSQRIGKPVKIRATRTIKVQTGPKHQSKKNIVAIYIGLPVVDSSQDNIIIEDVKSNKAGPNNVAFSLDGSTLWVEYMDAEPGFQDEILMTFSVEIYQRRAELSNIKPYDLQSPLYQQYTSKNNITDGNEIQNFTLFEAGITPNMDPVTKAKTIYNYVLKKLSYGRPADILSADKTHCGTYSAMFVKMCRDAGIPARRCAGFAFDSTAVNKVLTTVSGHNWAEFYVEGIGWIPVDPTMGDKKDSRKTYYFGAIDNARLCVSKSGFHNNLPLCYKNSAEDKIHFTYDASEFKPFQNPDTIQGAHRFQYRYDKPIQISVIDSYGPSLTILSRQGRFTKPIDSSRQL